MIQSYANHHWDAQERKTGVEQVKDGVNVDGADRENEGLEALQVQEESPDDAAMRAAMYESAQDAEVDKAMMAALLESKAEAEAIAAAMQVSQQEAEREEAMAAALLASKQEADMQEAMLAAVLESTQEAAREEALMAAFRESKEDELRQQQRRDEEAAMLQLTDAEMFSRAVADGDGGFIGAFLADDSCADSSGHAWGARDGTHTDMLIGGPGGPFLRDGGGGNNSMWRGASDYSAGPRDISRLLNTPASPAHLPPLILAARNDRAHCMELLLEKKANVDVVASDGKTALIHAARAGNDGSVKVLVRHRADVTVVDNEGMTALEYATQNERYCVVYIMQELRRLEQRQERKQQPPQLWRQHDEQAQHRDLERKHVYELKQKEKEKEKEREKEKEETKKRMHCEVEKGVKKKCAGKQGTQAKKEKGGGKQNELQREADDEEPPVVKRQQCSQVVQKVKEGEDKTETETEKKAETETETDKKTETEKKTERKIEIEKKMQVATETEGEKEGEEEKVEGKETENETEGVIEDEKEIETEKETENEAEAETKTETETERVRQAEERKGGLDGGDRESGIAAASQPEIKVHREKVASVKENDVHSETREEKTLEKEAHVQDKTVATATEMLSTDERGDACPGTPRAVEEAGDAVVKAAVTPATQLEGLTRALSEVEEKLRRCSQQQQEGTSASVLGLSADGG